MVGISAIVASLFFLGIEVRQEQNIARTQLASGIFDHFVQLDDALMDEQFPAIFIKMIDEPQNMTAEEMTQANAFLDRVVRMFQRENYLKIRGIFDDSDRIVDQLAPGVFGNRYAQSWWKVGKERFSLGLAARLSPKIESVPTNFSKLYYDQIVAGF